MARPTNGVSPRAAAACRRAGEQRGGAREGRVIKILERANSTIVGTLQSSKNFYYVIPDDPRLQHNIYVKPPAKEGRVGDKVVVRFEDWESRHVNPEGEIIEVLGPASAPGVDMLSIIRKYQLPLAGERQGDPALRPEQRIAWRLMHRRRVPSVRTARAAVSG